MTFPKFLAGLFLSASIALAVAPQSLPVYNSMAEMLASASPLSANKGVHVLGYYSANDGGGGDFVPVLSRVNIDNGMRFAAGLDSRYSFQRTLDANAEISVKYFGAKGDGVTDDISPIQAAIDYVSLVATNSGHKIHVPGGTYKISDTIRIYRPLTFEGDGISGYMFEYLTTMGTEIIYTGTGTAIQVKNTNLSLNAGYLHRVNLFAFRVHTDGNSFTSPKAQTGIYFNAEESNIDKVYVGGTTGDGFRTGMWFEDASTDSSVTHCILSDNWDNLFLDNTDFGSPSDLTIWRNNLYHATNMVHLVGGVAVRVIDNWMERADNAFLIDDNSTSGRTAVIDPHIMLNHFNNGNAGNVNSRFLRVKRTRTGQQFYVQGLTANQNSMWLDANADYAIEVDVTQGDGWLALNDWSFQNNDPRSAKTNLISNYAGLLPTWLNNQNASAAEEMAGTVGHLHAPGLDFTGDGGAATLKMGNAATGFTELVTPNGGSAFLRVGKDASDTTAALTLAREGTISGHLSLYDVYSDFTSAHGTLRVEGALELFPPSLNGVSYLWASPLSGPFSVLHIGANASLTSAPVPMTLMEVYAAETDIHGSLKLPDATANKLAIFDGTKNIVSSSLNISDLVPTTRTISTTTPLFGGASLGGNITLGIFQSGVTASGYLSQTDWNTFNNRANIGANLGAGQGLYASKTGTTLNYKSLVAGAGIALTSDASTVTIAATGGGGGVGEANTASNLGTGTGVFAAKSGVDLQFNSLAAGANVSLSLASGAITIAATGEANTGANLGPGTGVYASKSGTALQFNSLVGQNGITVGAASSGAIPISFTGTYHTTVAMSDYVTPLTTGTGKAYWRAPYALTLTSVRASVNTASSSGLVTVNIKKNGTTIFSTQLTIDAAEKTSTTAATPYVFSTTAVADDDEITFDIVAAGTNATGLQVKLFYTRP